MGLESSSVSAVPLRLTVQSKRKDVHLVDLAFYWTLKGQSIALILLFLSITLFLLKGAWPALERYGAGFLFTSVWDPVREVFGALPVIYGTLVTSLLAVLIATPLSIGIALFLNEIAPAPIAYALGFLIQMLAAIPSVVFGLWGVFVLAPWLRTSIEPILSNTLGFLPFFQGPPYGVGILAAAFILAIMIIPTISSIAQEVFKTVPRSLKESALGVGATRWEMMKLSILKSTRSGILGAIALGLGRALGETMAVTMVIGNRADISVFLFSPAQTMASVIANEYAEATSDLHLAALVEVGLALFLVTFVINSLARFMVWRSQLR